MVTEHDVAANETGDDESAKQFSALEQLRAAAGFAFCIERRCLRREHVPLGSRPQ